jgi:hypothetical protein
VSTPAHRTLAMLRPSSLLAPLLALAAGRPAAAGTHGCDKDCVCDGVDLSALRSKPYTMAEVTGPESHEGPDGWEYRISICDPLPHDVIPINCRTGIGHPWHAPHVVRFKRPHARNQSAPTGECQRVGSDVVLAQATHHNQVDPNSNEEVPGVQLVFTGEDGGKTHTVTANLLCDELAGDRPVRSLARQRTVPPSPSLGAPCGATCGLSFLADLCERWRRLLLLLSVRACTYSRIRCASRTWARRTRRSTRTRSTGRPRLRARRRPHLHAWVASALASISRRSWTPTKHLV